MIKEMTNEIQLSQVSGGASSFLVITSGGSSTS
jgi:hypothetical protein